MKGLLGNFLVAGGARGPPTDSFVTSWDAAAIDRLKGADKQTFTQIIGQMGEESRISQGLRQVLTNVEKMQSAGTRLYIVSRNRGGSVECVGILKMGYKKLFVRHSDSSFREISPLCCLDFYVHSSVQRGGHGKRLFVTMLEAENIKPHKIAYDRPSPKLFGFLKKYYGLSHFTPQENNFAVFHQYFDDATGPSSGRRSKRADSVPEPVALLTAENGGAAQYGANRAEQHGDHKGSQGGSGGTSSRSSNNSNLENLWAEGKAKDAAIKRDEGYRHRSRRRMVIDAAPRKMGQSRQQDDSRVPDTNRSRWQEGKVMGANGFEMGSLQALLQPHVAETDRGQRAEVERAPSEYSQGSRDNGGKNSGRRGDLSMRSGIRGVQQMQRHGDDQREFNNDQYQVNLSQRLKSRPF